MNFLEKYPEILSNDIGNVLTTFMYDLTLEVFPSLSWKTTSRRRQIAHQGPFSLLTQATP